MQNEKILAYLEGSCLGKANRASGTELERTLHISGTCLRKQVNRLRCKEHPIASDRSGYFMPPMPARSMTSPALVA